MSYELREGKRDITWQALRREEDEHDEAMMDFERYGDHSPRTFTKPTPPTFTPLPPWNGIKNSELLRHAICPQPNQTPERPYHDQKES